MPWLYVFICLRVRLHSSRNGFMMLANSRSIAAHTHTLHLPSLHTAPRSHKHTPTAQVTAQQHEQQHANMSSAERPRRERAPVSYTEDNDAAIAAALAEEEDEEEEEGEEEVRSLSV